MTRILFAAILCALLFDANAADVPSMNDFFSGNRLQDITISPDGRYLGLIVIKNGRESFVLIDRQKHDPATSVVSITPIDHASWCAWAKLTRVICSISYITNDSPMRFEQWIAIDTDGSPVKSLTGNRKTDYQSEGNARHFYFSELIVDWLRGDPENILVYMQGDAVRVSKSGAGGNTVSPAAIYKRNIYSAKVESLEKVEDLPSNAISQFVTDGQGNVRLVANYINSIVIPHVDPSMTLYGKPNGSSKWKMIAHVADSSNTEPHHLNPVTVVGDTDDAYATGDYQGHEALWKIDLTGATAPTIFFAQPGADVHPLLGPDQQLLGVEYYSDNSTVIYSDVKARQLQQCADEALPQQTNRLMEFSRNMKIAVVRSQNIENLTKFYVLDASVHPAHLQLVGSNYPSLDNVDLAKAERISFSAADGTQVHGYLTRPKNRVESSKVPLVVIPENRYFASRPAAFDPQAQFFASRGYAVLEIERRRTAQIIGDVTNKDLLDLNNTAYSDIIDGTKWAFVKGYGDAARTCIVGTNFGGNLALLAATRKRGDGLYRCAVAISGVNTLADNIGTPAVDGRIWIPHWYTYGEVTGPLHVEGGDIDVPVLIIRKSNVSRDEVRNLFWINQELTETGKPHKLIVLSGDSDAAIGDNNLQAVLTETDRFLSQYIGTP